MFIRKECPPHCWLKWIGLWEEVPPPRNLKNKNNGKRNDNDKIIIMANVINPCYVLGTSTLYTLHYLILAKKPKIYAVSFCTYYR